MRSGHRVSAKVSLRCITNPSGLEQQRDWGLPLIGGLVEPQLWWFHLGSPRQQRSAGGAAALGSGQSFSHWLPGGAAVSEQPQFSCLEPLFPGATLACGLESPKAAVCKQKVPSQAF